MKLKLILLMLFALSARAFSQSKNTVSITYGFASNDVIIYGAIGDFGYKGKGGTQFGVNYTHNFSPRFTLRSGVMFSSDDVELSTISTGTRIVKDGNIKLLTIPVVARGSFLKILFIEGGILGDIETNYSANGADGANHQATKQTGIGLEGGAGIQYNFGGLAIFVNPFVQNHALLRFGNHGSTFNLLDAGVRFGAGYSF